MKFRSLLQSLSRLLFVAVAANMGAAPQGPTIGRVAWLQGCWELQSQDRTVEEQWMAPRGKSMIGIGRTVRGDTLVEYEFLMIRERDGRLAYEAHPSGQASTVFMSSSVTDASIVFENLQHDFPQRIGYQRNGSGLLAWIEGPQRGQTRRIEFPYRRATCPA